jgi:hypothetical protein
VFPFQGSMSIIYSIWYTCITSYDALFIVWKYFTYLTKSNCICKNFRILILMIFKDNHFRGFNAHCTYIFYNFLDLFYYPHCNCIILNLVIQIDVAVYQQCGFESYTGKKNTFSLKNITYTLLVWMFGRS